MKYVLLILANSLTIAIIAAWAFSGPPESGSEKSAAIFVHLVAFALWLGLAWRLGYEYGRGDL